MKSKTILIIEKMEYARKMRDEWLKAEQAIIVGGQEYTIGSRRLRRADLDMIAARVKYWENEMAKLENGTTASIRVQRIVPRDV
jgi:hypothetical protein